MLKTLSCETIHELDNGIAGHLINAALKTAIADLEDRGEQDEKPRKVTIEIAMQKLKGITIIATTADAKIPPFRSNSTIAEGRRKDGTDSLLFQNQNAKRPDQGTFPVMDVEGGEIPTE